MLCNVSLIFSHHVFPAVYLRMLCQLSDHGMSLVKQVPIDDEETVRKVCKAIVTIISEVR